jgi:hypothetical protein
MFFIVPSSPNRGHRTLKQGGLIHRGHATITNVRGWWSQEVEGVTDRAGGEFDYHYQDVHRCRIAVTELVPGQKVVWHVVDAHLKGPEDPSEWTGTEITFEISQTGDGSEVCFSHRGSVPGFECFDSCSNAWGFYINGSLQRLITTGEGPTMPPWAQRNQPVTI